MVARTDHPDAAQLIAALSNHPQEERTVKVGERWSIKVERRIGEGGFSHVFCGVDNVGAQRDVAAKLVAFSDESEREAFAREVRLVKLVHDHKYIITLHGEAHVDNDGWMFLEMATGGDLFDRLADCGSLSERAAWPTFKALVQAVGHCHSKGVAHRDLKLENVMLDAADPHGIRLIDFGLAVQIRLRPNGEVDPTDCRHDCAGTQAYRAPEGRSGQYDPTKVDVWALGIILFSLCAGFFPLKEASDADWRYRRIEAQQAAAGRASTCETIFSMYKREMQPESEGMYRGHSPAPKRPCVEHQRPPRRNDTSQPTPHDAPPCRMEPLPCPFSEPLKNLIDGMLRINARQRFSVPQILAHAWYHNAPGRPLFGDSMHVYRGVRGVVYSQHDFHNGAPPICRQDNYENTRGGSTRCRA